MSQDQTKVFHGPFTATFDDGNGGTAIAITGMNKAAIEIGLTTKIVTEELGDGSEIYDSAGRQLVIKLTIDEVVAADLDGIKTLFLENDTNAHTLVVQFTNMPAATDTLTFSADAAPATSRPLFVETNLENGKAVITIQQSAPVGATIANLISIG